MDGVPAGHGADDPAVARGGCRPELGRALGEFGATITFAGNVQGRTQTMPLAVYNALSGGRLAGAITLSLVLLTVSVVVLVLLRDRWLQRA